MFTVRAGLLASALAGLALLAPASPASAVPTPSDPIAEGLAGPLQIDLGHRGQIYVSQSFSGVLTKVRGNGTTKDLVTEPGEVAGVASRGYAVAYTFTGGTEEEPVALLKHRRPNGRVTTIADLGAFEAKHNPDAHQRYGLRNVPASCLEQTPEFLHPYTGIIESHPYAVANADDGGWYVADAAANAVLHVSKWGKVSVVHVPRPAKTTITEDLVAELGLPDCLVGKTYAFEPVPTDVEVNPLGYLIVSLLPGGPEPGTPEGDVLGPRGMVMRISPGEGEWSILARGLSAATNVATAPGGRVYIAELAGGRISVLRNGTVSPLVDLASPAAVEYEDGRLYATTDVFGNGSLVRITGLGS